MGTESEQSKPWEELAKLTEAGLATELESFLQTLSAGETARAISRLAPEAQSALLLLLSPSDAAELIEEIPDAQAADMIEQLSAAEAAPIISEMSSAEQADLLGELDDADAAAILAEMSPEEASGARRLSAYPFDCAGGLMITEYLYFVESSSVGDVIDEMSLGADTYADFDVQYVYVVSEKGKLTGVLRLRDLLLSPRSRVLSSIMLREPFFVHDHSSLEELREIFDRHGYFGVPVTDVKRKLIGVVRREAVAEALAERSESDHLKSQGIVGGEELRSMPVLERSRRRLSWLSVNILLNLMAASVIAVYQETLSAVIALAVFLPIISDMSGCSGNQAVAVSLRELALGVVKPFELLHVWKREIVVGLINGVVLGLLIAVAAWLWQGNVYLGLVVGVALAVNTVLAVSIGGVLPLALKKLNRDPALASGPILTTITDMCGFLLALSLASAMLSKL